MAARAVPMLNGPWRESGKCIPFVAIEGKSDEKAHVPLHQDNRRTGDEDVYLMVSEYVHCAVPLRSSK